jgi:hypothetical protein
MAVAQRLFGVSAGDAARLLTLTGNQIQGASDKSERLANAFAGLAQRTDAISGFFSDLGNVALAGIAGGLSALIDYANAIIGAFGPLGDALVDVIGKFGGFDQVWPFLQTTGNEFLVMTAAIVGSVGAIVSAVTSVIEIFGRLLTAGLEMANGIKAAWNGMLAVIAGGPGATAALNAQVDLANKSSDAFVENLVGAKSAFTGLLPKMVTDGVAAGKGFYDGFKQAWGEGIAGIIKPKGGGGSLADAMKKAGKGGGAAAAGGLSPDEKDIRDLQRWTDHMLDAIDPTRRWMEETANLSDAFDRGLISGTQFDQILQRINQQHPPDDWTKAVNDFQKGLQSFGDQAASSLADAIVNGDNLGDVFKDLTKQLVQMAIQTLLLKPLFESVFGGGVGGGTGIFGGLLSLLGVGGKSFDAPQISGQSFDNKAFLASFRGAASGAGGGSVSAIKALSSSAGGQATIGSITMNITPDKTATISDSATGQRFGAEVTKLVQGLLVKESRPGGLLRRA